MSHVIIDLDASGVTAAPVEAVIHGTTYKLPGDIPAPLYVKLLALREQHAEAAELEPEQRAAAEQQVNHDLHAELLALFRQYQPDLERLPLGINEMVGAVGYIYSPASRQPAADPPKPARKAPAKRSTSTRTRTSAAKPRSTGSRSST